MKKYNRNVHISDEQEKYYDTFVVVKRTEKFYPEGDGARADVINRELVYTSFSTALDEYMKQCERAWQDIRYADSHKQSQIIAHTISLQGYNNTGLVNTEEEGNDYIPDTFRTAVYRYSPDE